jgi:murein hydrolase activator
MRRLLAIAMTIGPLFAAPPLQAQAQANGRRDLRESQLRLDSIRQERVRLQREMDGLQSKVRDASRELINIGRQRAASVGALQELDFQAAVLQTNVEQTQTELQTTRDQLDNQANVLRDRLRSIYKRGPLHAVGVLLSAESFGDLLSRYKYLNLVARYDRIVLDDVKRLETSLREQEDELRQGLTQLETLREQKSSEVESLQGIEGRTRAALVQVRRAEAATADRLQAADEDEKRLGAIIERIEKERIDEEKRGAGTAMPAAIATSDYGSLSWPVDGRLVYRFGPERKANGVTLVNNGIGIGAPVGTSVRAVRAGRVSHAGPFEGYGSMVMVNHGGGYYTLYMYLKTVTVSVGQTIATGQVVGTVGGEQTPEGPHLEFQVRAPIRGTIPEPVDPVGWLRSQSGS